MNIPVAYLSDCYYCSAPIDTRAVNVYQFTSGWCRNSNNGNSVTLSHRQHLFACAECIDRMKKGIPLGQLRMFEVTVPDAKP